MNIKTRKIVVAGLVAAIYAVLTMSLTFASYGVTQFRVAEALTVLPFFSSASIPGLFIGCLIANIISPAGPLDMVLGSAATLIAAIITYYIGKSNLKHKELLAPLPAVLINAAIIGPFLSYALNIPIIISTLQVGLGEIVCCYGLGLPLIYAIKKNSVLKAYL